MATLTVAAAAPTGVDIAGAAVAASDKFANTGQELLLVKNGSGGSINVTVTSQATIDPASGNLAVSDLVVAVADGATKALGPFKPGVYNDANGDVTFACSATTSVTAKVVKVAAT